MTTVSVIIPTYNRKDLIGYTLNSLRNDLHPGVDLEVIVVDDGSTDDTVAYVNSEFPSVHMLRNTSKGAPSARNAGLALASGRYIMYLDSDDLVGPGFFKKKVEALDGDESMDACYGAYDFFESDTDFNEKAIIFKHKYPEAVSKNDLRAHIINYLRGSFLPPNAIIWRKDFLRKIGGHDVSLPVNQDVELVLRALLNGLKMGGIKDDTHVYVRSHSIDERVGVAKSKHKLEQILALRKRLYTEIQKSAFGNDKDVYKAISTYLFNFWKSLRHTDKEIADQYLAFAKQVYWPLEIIGNPIFRLLGKLLGPDKAVKIKYSILKRD